MRIEPFNDFWLDCYTTILYSVLLSTNNVDKAYIYNNNYKYGIREIASSSVKKSCRGIYAYSDNMSLQEKLFDAKEIVNLYEKEDPISYIKKSVDEEKIVLVGVDLYYWINETFHYQRNHVLHHALVNSYDEEQRILRVLDTGASGYMEFEVSYETAIEAIRAFKEPSMLYVVNKASEGLGYTKSDIVCQAMEIIKSIDEIFKVQDTIMDMKGLETDDLKYFNDMFQTHLMAICNRAKVNRHLFMYSFVEHIIDDYDFCEKFAELERKYRVLKNTCIKAGCKNDVVQNWDYVKKNLLKLIYEEKEIWNHFLQSERYMELRRIF